MTKPTAVHNPTSRTYMFLGVQVTILLSGQETKGQFTLIQGVMPPGGDGGLHVHQNDDESMHLLEGTLQVTVGEDTFELAPGNSYFAPRTVPHRVRNTGAVPARSLVITTPGSPPSEPLSPNPLNHLRLIRVIEPDGIRA